MAKPRAIPAWPRALCEDWVAAYVGQLSLSAFRNEVDAGRIPAAVRLTAGRKAWLIEDLDGYLDRRRGGLSQSAREPSLAEMVAQWDDACAAFDVAGSKQTEAPRRARSGRPVPAARRGKASTGEAGILPGSR